MFSYYGSKSKIIDFYPKPKHHKIIEPFAGSARYALKYFDHEVLLVDKYEVVVKIWKYLQQCSPNDILKLPKFKVGETVEQFDLSEEERLFCGFLVAKGVSRPQKKASKWTTTLQPTWIPYQLKNIASQLFKIKHWRVELGSYNNIPNQIATWYIDSPYQFGGEHYKENSIDFTALALWCRDRLGQAIVCENTRAAWLPFMPFSELTGARKKSTESIWTNEYTSYRNEQLQLFTP